MPLTYLILTLTLGARVEVVSIPLPVTPLQCMFGAQAQAEAARYLAEHREFRGATVRVKCSPKQEGSA